MNNEERILAMLTQMQADLADVKATQTTQGEQLALQSDQLTALTEKVNDMDARLEGVEEVQDEMFRSIDTLTKRVDNVDAQLDKMGTQMKDVENRLTGIDTRLDKVENRLINVETRLVKVETRLVNTEGRLDKVETRLDSMDAKLEKTEAMQEELRDSVNKLAVKVDEKVIPYVKLLDEDYRAARNQTQLTERVDSLEDNVKTLNATARSHASRLPALEKAE